MKRKFSLVMSAAMILSLIAPMTNALAEDIQTPKQPLPKPLSQKLLRPVEPPTM